MSDILASMYFITCLVFCIFCSYFCAVIYIVLCSVHSVAPLLLMGPSAMNATLSENFTLVCSASGYPVPTIEWTHNGTLVNEDENDRVTISPQLITSRSVMSTLAVSMAAINDSGDYACIVNSSIGDFQNITAGPVTVLVQGETRFILHQYSVSLPCYSINCWSAPHPTHVNTSTVMLSQ